MRLCLAIVITSSIFLSACKTEMQFGSPEPNETPVMHNDWGNTYDNQKLNVLAPISENTQPEEQPAPVQVVQPKKLKSKLQTTANLPPTIEVITNAPAPIIDWQPNEAQLIRGNELLSGLQKEIGKKPTLPEMQQRLQSHMGLTAVQAQQVITVLGLI